MSDTSPTGDISGPVKWVCAMTLGAVGVLGIGQGLLSDRPDTQTTTPKLETVIAPDDADADSVPVVEHSGEPTRESEPGIQKLINVNTASAAELELLPRIGPVMAQRIIEDRLANGPYESDSDLDRVSGIGPKTLEKLSPLIRFD